MQRPVSNQTRHCGIRVALIAPVVRSSAILLDSIGDNIMKQEEAAACRMQVNERTDVSGTSAPLHP